MSSIGQQITAALSDWGREPVFLQLSHARGADYTTAAEFSTRIDNTAKQFSAWGIYAKQLIPVFLANSPDFVVVFLSLIRIGAIPVLAKLEYRTIELDEVFANARPAAVVAEKGHIPVLKPYLKNMIVIARSETGFGLVQAADPAPPSEDVPDDIASVNYTYRGYGYPLGATITHEQYLQGARALQERLQGAPGEKMLVILPMAHIFTLVGCVFAPLLHQMTSVIVDTMHPRLLFQHISEHRIDHIISVPEIYELLFRLRDPSIDLSSLKAFVSGGSNLTADSYHRLTDAFSVDVLHGYGLTECTPVSGNKRGEARPGTVGALCEQVTCRIKTPAQDGVGEILIKTPHMTGSYYRRSRETNEANEDGWFRTGDSGSIDNGHLVFVKELKNTRKVNGNMVDLEEVSRALLLDEEVEEAHVTWADNVLSAHLAFSAHVDFSTKTKQIKSFLRELLAEYKIPKRFETL